MQSATLVITGTNQLFPLISCLCQLLSFFFLLVLCWGIAPQTIFANTHAPLSLTFSLSCIQMRSYSRTKLSRTNTHTHCHSQKPPFWYLNTHTRTNTFLLILSLLHTHLSIISLAVSLTLSPSSLYFPVGRTRTLTHALAHTYSHAHGLFFKNIFFLFRAHSM